MEEKTISFLQKKYRRQSLLVDVRQSLLQRQGNRRRKQYCSWIKAISFYTKERKKTISFFLQKKERRHSTAEAEAVLQENNLVHRKTAILFLQKKERRQSLLVDVRQSLCCRGGGNPSCTSPTECYVSKTAPRKAWLNH